MFNNLVNRHDLANLWRKIRGGQAGALLRRLGLSPQQKVQRSWAHTGGQPTNWWDIPAVNERWNRLISGDPHTDYQQYVTQRYLAERDALTALSLGCGTGHRELRWAEMGTFAALVAYDLSEPRIRFAKEQAQARGFGALIDYRAENIYQAALPPNHYDLALAEQSLHHFSPLAEILQRLHHTLKPGGYFVINEFVGPTRFQWTDRQLEIINGLLAAMPQRYRTRWNSDALKQRVFRPSRLSMMLHDPSEAIESARILPLLRQMFEVVEERAYGGTLLQMLLADISHHFLADDPEAQCFLALLFEWEDQLLASGEIQSDFVLAVCRKRPT